jgi:HAD superfamily hydrolase (TIGR01509 family)
MIKVIIFDLGGIVVPEKDNQIKKEICEFLKISKNQFSIYLDGYKEKLTKGKISLLSFFKYLVKEFNLKKSAKQILEKYVELYARYSTLRDEKIISLIQKLKENYKIVALTNTEIEIAKYNKKNELFKYFEKSYLSTEMHLMKPELEIYLKILEDLQCLPNETVFIDDKTKYVNASKKVGMNAILFQNILQLKKELAFLSIKVE